MIAFRTLVILVLMLLSQTAEARCEKSATVADLGALGREGERAFAEMNLERLLVLSSKARQEIIPCLVDKISSNDAAGFHRLMALEAFTNNHGSRVVAEFHAARKLDSGYQLPVEVAGETHPLRKQYNQAAFAEDGKLEMVYPPEGGHVTVGGVTGAPRPEKTPAIIQVFDILNKIVETRYIQPGETLPVWGKNPFGITAKDLGLGRSALTEPKTWYISAGVCAIVTGVLYGIAMSNKSQYLDTSHPDTVDSDRNLQGFMDRANGFGTASVVSGSLSLAFALTGVGFHFGYDDKPTKAEDVK